MANSRMSSRKIHFYFLIVSFKIAAVRDILYSSSYETIFVLQTLWIRSYYIINIIVFIDTVFKNAPIIILKFPKKSRATQIFVDNCFVKFED